MPRLTLFGSYHFNRRSVVVPDLRSVAADADAIAVEFPIVEGGLRGFVRAVLYAPVVFLAGNLAFVLLQGPAFVGFTRDVVSSELSAALAVAGDREVHLVDRAVLDVLRDRSALWAVGNWLLLAGLVMVDPVSVAILVAVGLFATLPLGIRLRYRARWPAVGLVLLLAPLGWWTVLSGTIHSVVLLGTLLAFVVAVLVTAGDRNEAMLAEIAALGDGHGYDEVCLATGRAHVSGLADSAPGHGLEVDAVFGQRWLRRGEYLDQDDLLESLADSGLGLGPDPVRTDGVLRQRALGALVDLIAIVVLGFVFLLALAIASLATGAGPDASLVQPLGPGLTAGHVGAVGLLAIPFAYHGFQEARYGRSLGHRVAGIEVIRLRGGPPRRRDVAVRTILRLLDFLPAGYLLGLLVAGAGDGSRRLGDQFAGTAVVHASED